MSERMDFAPGGPGSAPRWTSSAKNGVGTAISPTSRVWFTLSHGILNEIYYPRVDSACTRDFGFVVTGSDGYFSEEKRNCTSDTRPMEPGVPGYTVSNTSRDGRYRIEKEIITDPARACLLQRVSFKALKGKVRDYRVHALLAPHLVNAGALNSAWIGEYEGQTILFAQGRWHYLALACSLPWRATSAGYVGTSDGWQQLRRDGTIEPGYQRADDGNVALTGEIAFGPRATRAVLALGFGQTEFEAAARATKSLEAGFDAARKSYVANWRGWQKGLKRLDREPSGEVNTYRVSTAVLAAHRAIDRPGAAVASLSIPWGFSKGDDDLGGYHLVWPRDLVETAGGFLAAGDWKAALATLEYLRQVQLQSGRWPQNFWVDGKPYWVGVQMDECAFPILLTGHLSRQGHLKGKALSHFMPMVRAAAGYILANGPVTGQDRWEENGGYSPFTLAVEISALLVAADLLEAEGDKPAAQHLRETADCWNEQVEKWTFGGDPKLCDELGISGYYVRIAPPAPTDTASPTTGMTTIHNRPHDRAQMPAFDVLSPDALALVRFGLRAADDPRILDTIKAIDHTLRVELPQGPLWYRYNGDGYGEHEDGRPFDGTGRGRLWPLLAGERAHYELAAGRRELAEALLTALEGSAGDGGLIPEQVWDGPAIPERELYRGKPSGSAMPLVWAHAEHVKLLRSLADGAVFDMPPQAVERYIKRQTGSDIRIWCFSNKITRMPRGKLLRIELGAPAMIHWSADGWTTVSDAETRDSGLNSHFVDLPTADLPAGHVVVFTIFWHGREQWEGTDFTVQIED